MEKRPSSPLPTGILAMLLAMPLTQTQAAAPPDATDEAVILTGWLHVTDGFMADVLLEVEVNNSVHYAEVSENGRFELSLPADTEVKLRFEKPGHLPKEVMVDTRHAGDFDRSGKPRKVRFAVILEAERHMAGFTYKGPVGTLGFEQGGGCVAVEHHRNMEQAPKEKPMVF